MTNEELMKFSGEHLLYEFRMFWWLSGVIRYMDGYMHDALLESWVGHLRNLINFFYRPRNGDDVIAKDFFELPGTWSPLEPTVLTDARERANKELSHITASRKFATDPSKDWNVAKLFEEVEPVATEFIKKASVAKLHADVRRLLGGNGQRLALVLGEESTSTNRMTRGPLLDSRMFAKDT